MERQGRHSRDTPYVSLMRIILYKTAALQTPLVHVEQSLIWFSFHSIIGNTTPHTMPSYACNGKLHPTGAMKIKMDAAFGNCSAHSISSSCAKCVVSPMKNNHSKLSVDIISLNVQSNTSIIRKMSNLSPCLRTGEKAWLIQCEPALTV